MGVWRERDINEMLAAAFYGACTGLVIGVYWLAGWLPLPWLALR